MRTSSNPGIVQEASTVVQAFDVLSGLTAHAQHHFLEDSLTFADDSFRHMLIVGHRQVTDAYLLALAAHHGAVLVTFDVKIGSLLPKGSPFEQHLTLLKP